MLTIFPKSPIYPVFSDASDQDSLIDLTDEDFEEEHSEESQKNPRQSEGEGTLEDPLIKKKDRPGPLLQIRRTPVCRQDRTAQVRDR